MTNEEVIASVGGKVVEDEFFNEKNESKAGFFSFKNIGDKIKGTYVGKRDIPAKGIYGAQIGYELKTDNGVMVCAFGLKKNNVHKSMKFVKLGQIVGFAYTGNFETEESKKNPKISPAHTIKVYISGMDPNYSEEMGGVELEDDEINVKDIPFA